MAFNKPKSAPTPYTNNDKSITASQEMELWLGPSPRGGSLFSDDEARHRAWFENRARLMELFAHDGRRPQAWWRYEAPIPFPGFSQERSALWEAGLLDKAEKRDLESRWHHEFRRSLAPDFTHLGLRGYEAHIAHLVFHDVPAALAERWATEAEAA